MFSFHFTGSLWFLLLLPPGLIILWRQYRGGTASAFSGAARLLFALQAMAMAVLVASLTRPELRVHRVEFHNPAILILRDQSSSFQGGGYLGLGRPYAGFEKDLEGKYAARGFDLNYVDFDESARQAASGNGFREGEIRLTSLAALADFLDSAAVPNLQAAFLFSDGIANLDSGKGSRSWKTPLYPVVFAPDSIAEAQPERVTILEAAGTKRAAQAPAGTRPVEIEAWWRPVGGASGERELVILQGGKSLLTRILPPGKGMSDQEPASAPQAPAAAAPVTGTAGLEGGIRKFRFRADLPIKAGEGPEPLRAVLRPAAAARNFNRFNDTLDVSYSRDRPRRTVHVFRPIRGLDEKGMVDVLSAWEGTRVAFFGIGDSARFSPAAQDQIWVEAGSAPPGSRLHAWLEGARAKVVLYARPGPGRNVRVSGLDAGTWLTYPVSAGIKAGRQAAEAFPADIVRLKAISSAPLAAPDADAGGEVLVEAGDGGRRGMIMGRIPLGPGKQAFFFCLPAIWGALFDPQGDFATRENIAAYIRSAHALADRNEDAARVSFPGRVFDGVPFDLSVSLPHRRKAAGTDIPGGGPYVLGMSGTEFSREWPIDSGGGGGGGEVVIGGVSLPAGDYRLELRSGAETLWRDSLIVAPKAALELARIGFDMDALGEAAARSGGRMVSPGTGGPDPARVSSVLPELEAAQVRAEKTRAVPLYNTLYQLLLVVLLLSLSWVLRKKWDID